MSTNYGGNGGDDDDDDLDDAFLESDHHGENRKGPPSVGDGEKEEEDYDDNNYFEEDDFESYGEGIESKIRQSPIVKPRNNLSQSSVSGTQGGGDTHKNHDDDDNENIFDDDDGGGGGKSQTGGVEENADEIDFEQQSMTLESYMEEFFKKKYENHNVKEGEDDPTPDAVDPTVCLSSFLIVRLAH
jgi:hypothetical protein